MKKTILFKMLLIAFASFITHLNAQTVSNNFADTMNDVFAGLDLNRVPHHLLSDYAMEFVDIRSYNGVNTANNYVHKGIYTSAYNTLLMARTKINVPDLVHPNQFESNWKAARVPYTIALSGLYYKYSRIRKNAYPNAITVLNNKLYDKYINGIWQNPYETDDIFMMTAPILKYNYKNMNVVLPKNLWYSNQGSHVQSIAVNFNDGNGYQTITMGQNIYVSYSSEGTYVWDYKLTLTNGQIRYSHSKLIVGNQTAPINNNILKRLPSEPCNFGSLVNDFDQVEFQGTTQLDGISNSATIQIDYIGSNPCGSITRPLIIAEGFESGLLGNENPLGDNDIDEFLDEARGPSIDLRNEIDDFDIIYVNWDNGKDDIRRNAALLQDIITWVNETKTTTAQNVVLGQSMGGLIARYALADMEQDPKQDHDTSLYISHDAPHQGANIPLGIQYFARHLVDQFVSTPLGDIDLPAAGGGSVTISDIQDIFNSVGTRQLLANNINGSFSLDNNAFNNFQTELQSKGYPQQTRNIAISNGSHCANDQEIQALQELLYLSGDIEPTILLDIVAYFFPLLSWAEGLGYAGLAIILEDPAYLAGFLPGRTNLNTRFEAKSLPNVGQTATIYRGRIRITKKIDFFLFTLSYDINVTDRNEVNPSAVQLPLDSYPGGAFNITFDLSELNDIDDGDADFLVNLNVTARTADSFNFIPTTTALDVGSGSITLNNNDYKRVYSAANPPTGNKTIPFDNFTSSYNTTGTNERHISFNTRNGDWLAAELDDNEEIFDCSFICSESYQISGPDKFCSTASYAIENLPSGVTVNWVSDPPEAVNFTQGSNTTTATLVSGYEGNIEITAEITSSSCGTSDPIIKSVRAGTPLTYMRRSCPNPANSYCYISGLIRNYTIGDQIALQIDLEGFSGGFGFGDPNIEWEKISGGFKFSTNNGEVDGIGYPRDNGNKSIGSVAILEMTQSGSQSLFFQTRARNEECGWGNWKFYHWDVQINSGFSFRYYPNPTQDELILESELLTDQEFTKESAQLNIELYDFYGNRIHKFNLSKNNKKERLDVSTLRKGTYILKLKDSDVEETYQIVID